MALALPSDDAPTTPRRAKSRNLLDERARGQARALERAARDAAPLAVVAAADGRDAAARLAVAVAADVGAIGAAGRAQCDAHGVAVAAQRIAQHRLREAEGSGDPREQRAWLLELRRAAADAAQHARAALATARDERAARRDALLDEGAAADATKGGGILAALGSSQGYTPTVGGQIANRPGGRDGYDPAAPGFASASEIVSASEPASAAPEHSRREPRWREEVTAEEKAEETVEEKLVRLASRGSVSRRGVIVEVSEEERAIVAARYGVLDPSRSVGGGGEEEGEYPPVLG